jgi:hypothetical protein
MGWFYAPNLEISNLWIYLPKLGWCWTKHIIFPFLYQDSENSWIFFSDAAEQFLIFQGSNWSPVP